MSKKKERLTETAHRVGEALDMPAKALPNFSHLQFWHNRQATMEGVEGVLHYSDSEIQLRLNGLVVTLLGADLHIRSYREQQIALTGTITEVHYRN